MIIQNEWNSWWNRSSSTWQNLSSLEWISFPNDTWATVSKAYSRVEWTQVMLNWDWTWWKFVMDWTYTVASRLNSTTALQYTWYDSDWIEYNYSSCWTWNWFNTYKYRCDITSYDNYYLRISVPVDNLWLWAKRYCWYWWCNEENVRPAKEWSTRDWWAYACRWWTDFHYSKVQVYIR